MRIALFLLLWVLAPSPALHAGDSLVAPPSEPIELRSFDADRIAALKTDPRYQYDRDLVKVPTLWERFKAWLGDLIASFFGSRTGDFITRNLLYILAVVGIIFAVVVLSRGSLRKVFHGAPRSSGSVTTVEEDIREMDLGALIREAEAAGDLRRAIRLHYLLVLRKLVDRGVLHWSPEHTDQDYMGQIKDPVLRSRFAQVALVFQWVWYGHAEVDRDRYEPMCRPFVEFEEVPAR